MLAAGAVVAGPEAIVVGGVSTAVEGGGAMDTGGGTVSVVAPGVVAGASVVLVRSVTT